MSAICKKSVARETFTNLWPLKPIGALHNEVKVFSFTCVRPPRIRVRLRRKLSSSMSGRESIDGISDCDILLWKHVLRGRFLGVECPLKIRHFISTDMDRKRVTLVRRKLCHGPESSSKKNVFAINDLLTAWKSIKITPVFNHFLVFLLCYSTECPILQRFLWFPDCLISRICDDTFMFYEL